MSSGYAAGSKRALISYASGVLACLVASPLPGAALCSGGATSAQPPPAVSFVRSYRAGFHAPARLAVDAADNLYVTDPTRGEVVVRSANGRVIARALGLGSPVSVAVDAAGQVYVGDTASGSVTAFGADWQRRFALGQGDGEFLLPNDIAIDPATGDVYVADSPAHRVKVYDAAGTPLRSFGGQGSDDGQFTFPTGIFFDAVAREVVVVDQLNFRVQIFDGAGNFLSCFGSQGSGAGKFNVPQGVWVDGAGRILVADGFEGRIQVLDRNGDFIDFIGAFGAGPSQLRVPMDLAIDRSNRLFVASANNARVEVFGLDAFTDPEAIVPAGVDVQPDPLDRATAGAAVVAYVETPGYALDQIVVSSMTANGVAASASPASIGDHDGNGVPDLRVEFPWDAFLATLPEEGEATVAVTGTLGSMQFEASDVIRVTTTRACRPDTVCVLGDADPQCNEAVCIEPLGCTVQAKPAGSPCDDGDTCTDGDTCSQGACVPGPRAFCDDANPCTDDACDAAVGCVHANNGNACDDGDACTGGDVCADGGCVGGPTPDCDDASICTDDACDTAVGCVHANNTAPCDDANACTGGDTCREGLCLGAEPLDCDDANPCTADACDPAGGCVYTSTAAACDDGDPGTASDVCDATGRCGGRVLTGNYAVLRWPPVPAPGVPLRLERNARAAGAVCADTIYGEAFSRIDGDAVALAAAGRAMVFDRATLVAGDLITGGGAILGLRNVEFGGRVDTGGAAAELDDCFAASYRAAARWNDFSALAASPGFAVDGIEVARWASLRIPSEGTLGGGQVVVDAAGIRLEAFATLTLAGGTDTDTVIVRIREAAPGLVLGYAARVVAEGVAPERVLFLVDGPVTLRNRAALAGSVLATGSIKIGRGGSVSGAMLGSSDIRLNGFATVGPYPFVGW